jgi:hypothetical protein
MRRKRRPVAEDELEAANLSCRDAYFVLNDMVGALPEDYMAIKLS